MSDSLKPFSEAAQRWTEQRSTEAEYESVLSAFNQACLPVDYGHPECDVALMTALLKEAGWEPPDTVIVYESDL